MWFKSFGSRMDLTLTVWTICGIWEFPIEKTSFESNDDNVSKLPKLGQLKPSSVILNQKSRDVIKIERICIFNFDWLEYAAWAYA